MPVQKRHRVHPSLESDDYEAFLEMAKKTKVKPAWLAKRAIELFVDKYRKDYYQLKLDLNLPT